MRGLSPAPSSSRTSATVWRCSRACGSAPSTTSTRRSARLTSSSVARKASTSWCGSLWMKPTVSVRTTRLAVAELDLAARRVERREEPVLGPRRLAAGQRVEQRRLARRWCSPRWRRWARAAGPGRAPAVSRCWRTCSTRSLSFLILSRMTRRSVSSWVSPGPRVPMPPPVRERCVHRRVRRGSWYSSWASSTWSRPSWVWACWAKMSRMRPLRSRTLHREQRLEGLLLVRAQLVVGDEQGEAGLRRALRSSSALPLPRYQLGSTCRRRCHSAPTTSAPAVSARLASSASESSARPAVVGRRSRRR